MKLLQACKIRAFQQTNRPSGRIGTRGVTIWPVWQSTSLSFLSMKSILHLPLPFSNSGQQRVVSQGFRERNFRSCLRAATKTCFYSLFRCGSSRGERCHLTVHSLQTLRLILGGEKNELPIHSGAKHTHARGQEVRIGNVKPSSGKRNESRRC